MWNNMCIYIRIHVICICILDNRTLQNTISNMIIIITSCKSTTASLSTNIRSQPPLSHSIIPPFHHCMQSFLVKNEIPISMTIIYSLKEDSTTTPDILITQTTIEPLNNKNFNSAIPLHPKAWRRS